MLVVACACCDRARLIKIEPAVCGPYTSEGILYKLAIHQSASDDLAGLAADVSTQQVAAKVFELFRELRANPSLLANLLDHGYCTSYIDISKFQQFWRQGQDLWRLKLWELEDAGLPYRIIYAYDSQSYRFHILAVVHRNFNYDDTHPTTQRILRDYGAL